MILGNPLLDDLNEFFGLCQNLLCFSLGGNKRIILINQHPLVAVRVRMRSSFLCIRRTIDMAALSIAELIAA